VGRPRKDEQGNCKHHGFTAYYWDGKQNRCKKCNSERVARHRVERKRTLVDYFGGKCQLCDYSRCYGALDFHHLDPSTKKFGLGEGGITHSLKECIKEAAKCALVCSNCHREIHSGLAAVSSNHLQKEKATKFLDTIRKKEEVTKQSKLCACGTRKFQTSKRCSKCANKAREKIQWPDTDVLLKMVNETSKCAVAKTLVVSESAVRKHIKKYIHL